MTRTLPTNATNWTFDADGLAVESGIYLTDPEFTDDGDLFGVPMTSGTLYVDYREWLVEAEPEPVTLYSRDDVEAALGTVDPLNPVAYAADMALRNTYTAVNGTNTTAAGTTTDGVIAVNIGGDPATQALWTAALDTIEEVDDAYDLVLLTTDPAIQALGRTHVLAQSTDDAGFYRRILMPAVLDETAAVVA